jgi:hypothetical protein
MINTLQFKLVDPAHVKSLELCDLDQEVSVEEEIDPSSIVD